MTAPLQIEPSRGTGDVPVEPSVADEQLFEQKEVAGLSQMQIVRRRFFRHKGAMISLLVLGFIVTTSVTSVGLGPIPGWWKWSHTDVVPVTADDGPTMSLRPTWLGGAGIRFGDHPGQDAEHTQIDHSRIAQQLAGREPQTIRTWADRTDCQRHQHEPAGNGERVLQVAERGRDRRHAHPTHRPSAVR